MTKHRHHRVGAALYYGVSLVGDAISRLVAFIAKLHTNRSHDRLVLGFAMRTDLLRRTCVRLVLLAVSGVAAVRAQIPVAPAPPTQLAPVIVQGRDTDLIGVASSASQGIVGSADLGTRPFLRRGELLEVIPGVVITQHSGNGKANQYFLRGFNLDHGTDFALSVDGVPVNMRSHAHGQGYADLNFLIPEATQQVDYSKGPFYAEVGDFSAPGAAEFRQVDSFARPFMVVGLGQNHFARVVLGGSQALARGTLTGVLEVSHDDGPWQMKENGNRLNGYVRRAWGGTAVDYRLTGMIYRGEWRSSDQIPLRAVEAGSLERRGNVDPTDGGVSDRASLSFDASWRGTSATTRLNAYALFYRLNLFSNFTYFLDDPVNGDQFNQRDRRWVLGGAVERTWTHTGGLTRGETRVGLQGRADFIADLGLHRTTRRVRTSTTRDDEVEEGSLGAFARHETRWNDWLRSTAGLRVDGYAFDVDSDEPRNSGSKLAQIVSPKFMVALGPWVKTELYVNAGAGFHSNDARGATIRKDPSDGITHVDRVTPLARSRGAEVGVRTSAIPRLVSTFSTWALDLDSELVFVGDAGGTQPTGHTRRYGVEMANFYRMAPWCAFDGDLSLTRARYREDSGGGTRIANSIATVITAGITLGHNEGWFGSARLRYYGSQPLIEDNSVRAPSSTLCNANFGWRSRDWELGVAILNVFDRQDYDIAYYYTSRLPDEAALGVDDIHFHPAEPRTVRLSVRRRF
jgi:hypothetical protein